MSGHNLLEQELDSEHRQLDPGDTGVLKPDRQRAYFGLTTGASGEARTIIAPQTENQEVTLAFETDGGGDAVVTFPAGIDATGNTIVTFAIAGEVLRFIGVKIGSTLTWRLTSVLDGVVAS